LAFQSTFPFEATAAHADALSLLRVLPVRDGHWDELLDSSGSLREPWRQFFELLGDDGIAGLEHNTASVAQQIRDNDISYNVYADKGEPRPWALDLLPLLIGEAEWAEIEQGVIQRAQLLNAVVADVYGPQTLLQRGQLPPALVFGHPGYLRSVRGFTPPGGQYLQVVAVDLARAANGNWTVMSHRTEAPSGLGYALENRLIVSSQFAEPFRSLHVSRLAPTYSQLIATLVQSARAVMHGDATDSSPHIALLTPGPFSETYFEHVFLARYLGVTLVEGKDLTVRDDMLYLKTLAGLERVHVVLRRLDDAFCDPVELRADSTIGVPGLLQVMRAGNVIVSNVPGSGFVECWAKICCCRACPPGGAARKRRASTPSRIWTKPFSCRRGRLRSATVRRVWSKACSHSMPGATGSKRCPIASQFNGRCRIRVRRVTRTARWAAVRRCCACMLSRISTAAGM
jgi:uncharacterized circularly permuted ATP-grasp superfamily protein